MAKVAKYPSSSDYAEALQNTAVCFRDRDLKGGQVQATPLGMPRAISGNFASVFSVVGRNGKRYAVKCFTRHVLDQQVRYEAVSAGLADLGKSWQIGFDYQQSGILVRGAWYPILKMEWIEASGLLSWLEANLDNSGAIADVALDFADMVNDLQDAGLAHGDLQHGNLLVDRTGRLRLIDYDGMFAKSLLEQGAAEIGHVNYQSPLRTMKDYDEKLDDFSAWLIYVSLLLLIEDPGLWPEFHAEGEEKLLFGREDFGDRTVLSALSGLPQFSPALDSLEACWSARRLDQVPTFEPSVLPAPSEILIGYAYDDLPTSYDLPRSRDPADPPPNSGRGKERLSPVTFSGGLVLSRLSLTLATLGLLGVPAAALWPLVGLPLAALALVAAVAVGVPAYRAQPEYAGKQRAAAALDAARRERQAAATRVRTGVLTPAQSRYPAAPTAPATPTAANPRPSASPEQVAIDRATADAQEEKARVMEALEQLQQNEAASMREALLAVQEAHIVVQLKPLVISRSILWGIHPSVTRRMADVGIVTAADIATVEAATGSGSRNVGLIFDRRGQRYRINGLDATGIQALRAWHRNEVAKAQRNAPNVLPPDEVVALRKSAEDERQRLKAQQAKLVRRISQEARAVKKRQQADQLRMRHSGGGGRRRVAAPAPAQRTVRELAQEAADAAAEAENLAAATVASYAGIRLDRFLLR